MFGAVNRDKDYLDKSKEYRKVLYAELNARKSQPKNLREKLNWLWFRHRSFFALDEAEHVTLGALAAFVYRPDLWCWIFALGQITIALFRLAQRGNQLISRPDSLTYPLRK
jgi:hypothetical protein